MNDKLNFPIGIFQLSDEEKELSLSFYGKIIKTVIAPSHTYKELVHLENENTYLFPERDLTFSQCCDFFNQLVSNSQPEVIVITKDIQIILDVLNPCARLLLENGELDELSVKTFHANIHDIHITVLGENCKEVKTNATKKIQEMIDAKNADQTYDTRIANLIGDELIRRFGFGL